MRKQLKRLKAFVRHPVTQLVTGLVLIISGMAEVAYDFMDAEKNFRIGVHHGVLMFGLIQVIGSLPDLLEGIDRTFEAVEKREE